MNFEEYLKMLERQKQFRKLYESSFKTALNLSKTYPNYEVLNQVGYIQNKIPNNLQLIYDAAGIKNLINASLPKNHFINDPFKSWDASAITNHMSVWNRVSTLTQPYLGITKIMNSITLPYEQFKIEVYYLVEETI